MTAPGNHARMAHQSFATILHTFGSSYPIEVKELLGDASVSTMQGYRKVDPVKLSVGLEANQLTHL